MGKQSRKSQRLRRGYQKRMKCQKNEESTESVVSASSESTPHTSVGVAEHASRLQCDIATRSTLFPASGNEPLHYPSSRALALQIGVRYTRVFMLEHGRSRVHLPTTVVL